jgi:hypothetical protein
MASDSNTINELVDDSDDDPTAELKMLVEADLVDIESNNVVNHASEVQELNRQIDDAQLDIAALGSELKLKNELIDVFKRQIKVLREANAQMVSQKTAVSNGTEHGEATSKNGERRLLVAVGDKGSTEYVIGPGRVTLGASSDNDIQLKSSYISRHHAQIVNSSTDCILGDLNSTNGTFVNSSRINRYALRDGDSVTVGNLRFKFATHRPESPDP